MRKDRDAMFIHGVPVRLLGMLISILAVLKSLPGVLLPGLVILFLMGLRSATMRVGSAVVQLGSSLMVFVVRSVVITSRHLRAHDPLLGAFRCASCMVFLPGEAQATPLSCARDGPISSGAAYLPRMASDRRNLDERAVGWPVSGAAESSELNWRNAWPPDADFALAMADYAPLRLRISIRRTEPREQ